MYHQASTKLCLPLVMTPTSIKKTFRTLDPSIWIIYTLLSWKMNRLKEFSDISWFMVCYYKESYWKLL